MTFGHFWNCKKWNLVKKFFREIELFNFTSFFGLDFFKFSGTLCNAKIPLKYLSVKSACESNQAWKNIFILYFISRVFWTGLFLIFCLFTFLINICLHFFRREYRRMNDFLIDGMYNELWFEALIYYISKKTTFWL